MWLLTLWDTPAQPAGLCWVWRLGPAPCRRHQTTSEGCFCICTQQSDAESQCCHLEGGEGRNRLTVVSLLDESRRFLQRWWCLSASRCRWNWNRRDGVSLRTQTDEKTSTEWNYTQRDFRVTLRAYTKNFNLFKFKETIFTTKYRKKAKWINCTQKAG